MAFSTYTLIGPWTDDAAPDLDAANMTLIDQGIRNAMFPPSVSVRHTANQATVTATYLTLTFDTEIFDTETMHSTGTNPERITIPTGATGRYLVTGTAEFASNATGYREVLLRINGTTSSGRQMMPAVNGAVTVVEATALLQLSAADYVEMRVRQSSGGALDVVTNSLLSPIFSAVRVS